MNEMDGEIWEMNNGNVTAVKINGVIFRKEASDKKPVDIVMERLKEINKTKEKTKYCPICKKTKPISEFGKDKYQSDGHGYACRVCLNQKARERARKKRLMSKTTHKKCSHCNETKPVSEFYKRKDSQDGYQFWCIECLKQSNKKPKIVKEERKEAPRIDVSPYDDVPVKSADTSDRKYLKWYKFKIRS